VAQPLTLGAAATPEFEPAGVIESAAPQAHSDLMGSATRISEAGGWAAFVRRCLLLVAMLCACGHDVSEAAPVPILKLQGALDPASADYLMRGIRRAGEAGAPLVVIELDTPGGLESSMRQVVQAILDAPVPVAVYVTPQGARAASAGTYLLYAAHVAAMTPATTLGAATPVAIGLPSGIREPKDDDGVAKRPGGAASQARPGSSDTMTAKQVHDAAAFIRGLAQLRGRNAEWAERAVRESVSLTATEASQAKVIDVIAKDRFDLLTQIDGRTVRVQGAEHRIASRGAAHELRLPDWRHQLLSVIAHPSVALLLMMIGIWGLFFEFAAPGHGISGVTGTICLLLAAFALQLLPVNYAALGLIVLGLALLLAELFAPTFGVLGVGGVIALAAGSLLLFDTEVPGYGVPVSLVLALAAVSLVLVALASGAALKTRSRPVVSGRNTLVGATGEVLESAHGETWAEVMGERWKVSSAQPLVRGQRVRVLGSHDLTLDVQPESEKTSSQGVVAS
jgi:membrane-bound serine protease (ClpP class)